MQKHSLLALAGIALATSAGAQTLMIPESTNDKVMLFSAVDGSLINANFIDLTTATPAPVTPIEAIEVNDEIWISDQSADTVFRYSSDGTTFLGTFGAGRDNLRGIGYINGSVYVTNSGAGGSGFGDVCKEYATDGTLLNSIPIGNPMDVIDNGGELLITDTTTETLERFAYDGTYLGAFHVSDGVTGIDFPHQIARRANGNVLAAGNSTPKGIYEYDSAGTQINYWDPAAASTAGSRGVTELDNGNLLFTDSFGVYTLDPNTSSITMVHGGISARFITRGGGLAAPASAYCFGDGSGTVCPCGNLGSSDSGCANSTGVGAIMSASGSASVVADDLVLHGSQLPAGVPSLFFMGTIQVNGGTGSPFGDGLLCAGGSIQRMQVVIVDGTGDAATSVPIASGFGATPGNTNTLQLWYRDPGGPCSGQFNTTNAMSIAWQ